MPEASHAAFAKKSSAYAPGALFSVPTMEMLPPLTVAAVTIGKFCRLFGPVSTSPPSLRVTPLLPRSIPRPVFEKIEFARTLLPVPEMTATPLPTLNAMTLPAPAPRPPTVPDPPAIEMPCDPFGRASMPEIVVPIRLPRTWFPTLMIDTPVFVLPEITF